MDYKRNLDRRIRCGEAKITVGDYISEDVQDGKAKTLGGNHDGPFSVLDRTTHTFVIKLGDVVERFNCDRVVLVPTPGTNAIPRDELEANSEELAAKNIEGPSRLVENVVDHRNEG